MTLFLHPYYAGELGLGLAAISTVLLLSRLTDFVTDPLMGYLSDRTLRRFGGRRIYLLIGAGAVAGALYLVFSPPSLESEGSRCRRHRRQQWHRPLSLRVAGPPRPDGDCGRSPTRVH